MITKAQRITLMADYWPKACRAQGWDGKDKPLRLRELSKAVGRDILSANDLNHTSDFDKVKAHLGMLANNLSATIETDHQDIGRARRLRATIREQLKCLGVYIDDASAYLESIIRDKFKHGSRAEPLTIDDLTATPIIRTDRGGQLGEIPSQLDQIVMTLGRAIQVRRKESGDSIHDMKIRADVECTCKLCQQKSESENSAGVLRDARGVCANCNPF